MSALPPPGMPPPSTPGTPPVTGATPNRPKRPVWRRWWVIAIGVILVLGAISSATGKKKPATSSTPTTAKAAAATTAATVVKQQQTTAAAVATTAAPATAPPTTAAPTTIVPPTTAEPTTTLTPVPTIRDGLALIGADAQPGRYINSKVSSGCYWERLKDLSGSLDGLLANDNPSGQSIVDIVDGDVAFRSRRCGAWQLYTTPLPAVPTFGDGTWLVGEQIDPGRWKSTGGEGCYWARMSGFAGGLHGILANDNVDGPTIVDIQPSDIGFISKRCGTWSPA